MNEELLLELEYLLNIINDPEYIKEVINASIPMQLMAVRKKPELIQYIENPSDIVQYTAIEVSNGDVIKYINNLSIDVILSYIFENPWIYNSLEQKFKDNEILQLVLVNSDPRYIEDIYKPSELVQATAIKIKPSVIHRIHNPSNEIINLAISLDKDLKYSLIYSVYR